MYFIYFTNCAVDTGAFLSLALFYYTPLLGSYVLCDRQGHITRNNMRPSVTQVVSLIQFNEHNMATVCSRKKCLETLLIIKPTRCTNFSNFILE
jgi:hypothetical protein